MRVVPEGGLHSPLWRSKLDASEGQKNRIAREALNLLKVIENELNPEGFTLEEMREEGFGLEIDEKRFNLLFGFLKDMGYVEAIDEDGSQYRLNQEKLAPPIPSYPV
jgi:hypothetical protein